MKQPVDLVLATLDLPSHQLIDFLGILRDDYPETRVIGMSEQMVSKQHIESMIRVGSLGVNKVLMRPLAEDELHSAVDHELETMVSFV